MSKPIFLQIETGLISQAQQYGLAVLLMLAVIFVLYKWFAESRKRDMERMNTLELKVDKLEDERKTERLALISLIGEIKTLVVDTTNVVKQNTAVMEEVMEHIGNNVFEPISKSKGSK